MPHDFDVVKYGFGSSNLLSKRLSRYVDADPIYSYRRESNLAKPRTQVHGDVSSQLGPTRVLRNWTAARPPFVPENGKDDRLQAPSRPDSGAQTAVLPVSKDRQMTRGEPQNGSEERKYRLNFRSRGFYRPNLTTVIHKQAIIDPLKRVRRLSLRESYARPKSLVWSDSVSWSSRANGIMASLSKLVKHIQSKLHRFWTRWGKGSRSRDRKYSTCVSRKRKGRSSF